MVDISLYTGATIASSCFPTIYDLKEQRSEINLQLTSTHNMANSERMAMIDADARGKPETADSIDQGE
jgi:hypothetical protein